tara:strand:- start:2108 stop:2437 length:330 start_codon:yes stop_codon:yes gene_type:complete
MSGKSKRKYFPNNVRRIQEVPDELFEAHEYEELMEWRVCSWELASNIACVIRCDNKQTGKIKEYTYQQHGSACKKIEALLEDPNNVVTIATDDSIHQLFHKDELTDDED